MFFAPLVDTVAHDRHTQTQGVRLKSDPIGYPPRGMSRDEAARYLGVGTTKFDEMVADGRMPPTKAN